MEQTKNTSSPRKRLNKSQRRYISAQKGLIRRTVSDPAEQQQRIAALYPKPKEVKAEKTKPAK